MVFVDGGVALRRSSDGRSNSNAIRTRSEALRTNKAFWRTRGKALGRRVSNGRRRASKAAIRAGSKALRRYSVRGRSEASGLTHGRCNDGLKMRAIVSRGASGAVRVRAVMTAVMFHDTATFPILAHRDHTNAAEDSPNANEDNVEKSHAAGCWGGVVLPVVGIISVAIRRRPDNDHSARAAIVAIPGVTVR